MGMRRLEAVYSKTAAKTDRRNGRWELGGLFRYRLAVGAIAVGRIAGALAVAEPDFFILGQGELQRAFTCAFVSTVAHGLMTAEAAGAPPMIASFEFYGNGHRFEMCLV